MSPTEQLISQHQKHKGERSPLNTRSESKEKELQRLQHNILEPLKTFQLFAQLPVEIRVDIWRHLIPPPRIIPAGLKLELPDLERRMERFFCIDRNDGGRKVLAVAFNRLFEHNTLLPEKTSRVHHNARIPAITHVCQESRQIVIGMYGTCFGTSLAPTSTVYAKSFLSDLTGRQVLSLVPRKCLIWPGITYRPQYDIIYLRPSPGTLNAWDVLRAAKADELHTGSIRRLIIDVIGFEQILPRLMPPNPLFPQLLELFVTSSELGPAGEFLTPKVIEARAKQAVLNYLKKPRGTMRNFSFIRYVSWPFVQQLHTSKEWHYPKGRLKLLPFPKAIEE